MGFFGRLERKYGKYAIKDLMYYIIVLYIAGFVIELFMPEIYDTYLALDMYEIIFHFQIWRIFTFIMQPPESSIIFMVFALYLYYMIGINLERVWGAFRFNVYFFMGVLFQIIAALVVYLIAGFTPQLSTHYINLSLFLAFACVYPDMQLYLFFIIPIKIKWLGILDGVYFAYTVAIYLYYGANSTLPMYKHAYYAVAISALVAMLNFIVFFLMTRNYRKISPQEIKRKKNYKKVVKFEQKSANRIHKCSICGKTSDEFPNVTFRYCSKCNGNYEYCEDHIFTHEHVQ